MTFNNDPIDDSRKWSMSLHTPGFGLRNHFFGKPPLGLLDNKYGEDPESSDRKSIQDSSLRNTNLASNRRCSMNAYHDCEEAASLSNTAGGTSLPTPAQGYNSYGPYRAGNNAYMNGDERFYISPATDVSAVVKLWETPDRDWSHGFGHIAVSQPHITPEADPGMSCQTESTAYIHDTNHGERCVIDLYFQEQKAQHDTKASGVVTESLAALQLDSPRDPTVAQSCPSYADEDIHIRIKVPIVLRPLPFNGVTLSSSMAESKQTGVCTIANLTGNLLADKLLCGSKHQSSLISTKAKKGNITIGPPEMLHMQDPKQVTNTIPATPCEPKFNPGIAGGVAVSGNHLADQPTGTDTTANDSASCELTHPEEWLYAVRAEAWAQCHKLIATTGNAFANFTNNTEYHVTNDNCKVEAGGLPTISEVDEEGCVIAAEEKRRTKRGGESTGVGINSIKESPIEKTQANRKAPAGPPRRSVRLADKERRLKEGLPCGTTKRGN